MQLEVGSILTGRVTGITKFGAFVELPGGSTGMVHISEVASSYVKEISDFVSPNQEVKVKILSIGDDGKIKLSMKQAAPPPPPAQRRSAGQEKRDLSTYEWRPQRRPEGQSFEDMLNKFKQASDEKLGDLKRVTESKRGSGGGRRGGSR